MDFNERLQKALDRGHRTSDARARAETEKKLNEQEIQRLHTQYRLEISERIEKCLQQVADNLPGFRFETLVGEKGWGAAISRDDVEITPGQGRTNYFSRLEMVIMPMTKYKVLDLAAKGTIRNKEFFRRNHYQPLQEVDLTSLTELIDLWCLEYAQLYAAKS